MVKSLNGGDAAYIVLTELDDQKLFSRVMASIKSTASYFSEKFFFKNILKVFRNLLSPQ